MLSRERIASWAALIGDGDIRSSWWLGPNAGILDRWGYPAAWRAGAAERLAHVYPPDVCHDLVEMVFGIPLIASLFVHVAPWVVPALDLARWLELVGVGPELDEYLPRLRHPNEYAGSRAELSAWAGLCERQLRVFPVPQAGAWVRSRSRTTERRPDLQVVTLAREYLIEVKATRRSDADRIEEQLEFGTMPWFGDWAERNRALRFEVDPPSSGLAPWFERSGVEIRDALRKAAESLWRRGAPPGVYPIPGIGRVTVTMTEGNGIDVVLSGDARRNTNVRKALNLVEEGITKFEPGDAGIVLVEAGPRTDVPSVVAGINRLALDAGRELFRSCRFVVVRVPGVRVLGDTEIRTALYIFPLRITDVFDATDRHVLAALAGPTPPSQHIKHRVERRAPPWVSGLLEAPPALPG